MKYEFWYNNSNNNNNNNNNANNTDVLYNIQFL